MSQNEVFAGYQWIIGVLSADSALSGYAPGGVYRALAPVRTTAPYVIVTFQSGPDTRTTQAVRILTQPLYQVVAVGPASGSVALVNAANRIDDLLKLASGSVSGGYIAASYRESPLSLDELVDGETWTRIGGLYRLLVQQTT